MKEFLQHLRKVRLLRVSALQDACPVMRCAGAHASPYLSALSLCCAASYRGHRWRLRLSQDLRAAGFRWCPPAPSHAASQNEEVVAACSAEHVQGRLGWFSVSALYIVHNHVPALIPSTFTTSKHKLRLGCTAGLHAFWPG